MSEATDLVETYRSEDGRTIIEDRNHFSQVLRCACGAISHDGRHWSERNSRRQSERSAS